jgi:hypothetical protein
MKERTAAMATPPRLKRYQDNIKLHAQLVITSNILNTNNSNYNVMTDAFRQVCTAPFHKFQPGRRLFFFNARRILVLKIATRLPPCSRAYL